MITLSSLTILISILLLVVNLSLRSCAGSNLNPAAYVFNDPSDNGYDGFDDAGAHLIKLNQNLTTQVELELGLVLNPSDVCRVAAEKFGKAVSNFTLCSVTNSRPISICRDCVFHYLSVLSSHHEFISTIDESGTICSQYYLNRDRMEIVSAAQKYVIDLWNQGNCDYCFEKNADGTLLPNRTNDTIIFEEYYNDTRDCFDVFTNDSCSDCKEFYHELNRIYVRILDKQDSVCLDIVDTMNTTREIWSKVFLCLPMRRLEFGIIFGISFVALIPIVFYPMAFILSKKQEAKVVQQKRLAEVFGINASQSTSIEVVGGSHNANLIPSRRKAEASSSNPLSFIKRRASVTF